MKIYCGLKAYHLTISCLNDHPTQNSLTFEDVSQLFQNSRYFWSIIIRILRKHRGVSYDPFTESMQKLCPLGICASWEGYDFDEN